MFVLFFPCNYITNISNQEGFSFFFFFSLLYFIKSLHALKNSVAAFDKVREMLIGKDLMYLVYTMS